MLKLKVHSLLDNSNLLNDDDGEMDDEEANLSVSHTDSEAVAVVFKKEYFRNKSIAHEHKSPLTTKKGTQQFKIVRVSAKKLNDDEYFNEDEGNLPLRLKVQCANDKIKSNNPIMTKEKNLSDRSYSRLAFAMSKAAKTLLKEQENLVET